MEEKNARIVKTMLGFEDHDLLSFMITLTYGSAEQGFGGYCLDEPIQDANGKFLRRQGVAFGMEAIRSVLKTLGVKTWEKLPGTACRVRADRNKVYAIGHYLNDDWLDIEKLAKEFYP